MLAAFCLTTYALLSVDFSDRAILRDYVASLAVTEFFLAFACFFGICKHNYNGTRNQEDGGGRSTPELPLPSYEEALNFDQKKRASSLDKDPERCPDRSDSVSLESSEELPSFEMAVHM